MDGEISSELLINMTEVASARSHSWKLLRELFGLPGVSLVARLLDGAFTAELRASTAWVTPGQGSATLDALHATFEQYARTSGGLERGAVVNELLDEHRKLEALFEAERGTTALLPGLWESMERQQEMCGREALAWEAGDAGIAKALRARQHEILENELIPLFPALCEIYRNHSGAKIYEAAGWLGLSLFSLESGRGYLT